MNRRTARGALELGALGVVFGDIGTSPLYTVQTVFDPTDPHHVQVSTEHVYGVVSLIFWAVVAVVMVTYILLVMRADNDGEGGIMALITLIRRRGAPGGRRTAIFLALLGVFGASLFFGDSMITPAISVLSAISGVEVVTPSVADLVVPITAVVIIGLFALQRFGSAAQGDLVHRAADHLGKLLRTLFLCDYFSNAEFRRELHTLLNRGESVHQLQRAIYIGKVAPERGRRRDEMITISGSLTLLTNLVIAWNTQRMQATVDDWRRKGQLIDDDWLRRMGPAHFAHVNFRGTLSFPIDLYQEMLLDAAPWRKAGSL